MKRSSIPFFLTIFTILGVGTLTAQKRTIVGKVCGDPMSACKTRETFQPYELPFDHGKNVAIGNLDGSVRLLDVESGKAVASLVCTPARYRAAIHG